MGGFAALGIGVGTAQADDGGWCPTPVPGVWAPCPDFDAPPGQVGVGPPGQFKKDQWLAPGVENPFFGVPPGHWDDGH